jgi:Tfp pilus assembly protein PilP
VTRATILVLGLVAALVVGLQAPVALAQDEPREEPPAEAGQEGAAEEPAPPEELEDIDQLLEGEEEILAGEGFSYDAGGRRDPFKSLLAPSKAQDLRGPRPEGIPGLLIDEVIITGIFRTQEGYVAQVQSAESERSYLLKQGDELYDGDVVRITDNEIVFKQIVQDPTALKPFREVVKTLNPDQP